MEGIKTAQFDPAESYPAHAFAFGPNEFYCATKRGHQKLNKGDWIVEFSTGEIVVVTDATYRAHFARENVKAKKHRQRA